MAVLDLDALKSTELVSLSDRRVIEIRTLDVHGERAVRANLVHTERALPRAYADELLACSSDLNRVEIPTLRAADRHRLITAVVRVNDWEHDWRALYGSHLTADERLHAVAAWDYERTRAALTARLREIGRAHREDAAAAGRAIVAPHRVGIAAATAPNRGVTDAVRKMKAVSDSLEKMRMVMGYGGAMSALHSVTKPNPLIAAAVTRPSLVSVAKPVSIMPTIARVNTTILAGDQMRTAIATVTRGIKPPGFVAANLVRDQMAARTSLLAATRWNEMLRPMWGRATASSVVAPVIGESFQSRIASIVEPFKRFDGVRLWSEQAADWAIIDQFFTSWEEHAFWLLFSVLGIRSGAKLAKLPNAEVEPVVFDALERVFAHDELLDAFIAHLPAVSDLSGPYRDQMRQSLEFVRVGVYHLAQPLLHGAFESMLRRAMERRGLPARKGGRFTAAEKLMTELFAPGDLLLRFARSIFFGVGNAHRHGAAEDGHREIVLAGLVALAGYMDSSTGSEAVEIVVDRMGRQLDAVIEERSAVQAALLSPTI